MKFERLGEKITQIRGISYKPNDISTIPLPEYVPILKANNIQEDGIVIKDLIYIHKSKVRPEQFIKKGDLLLAASSGSKDIVGKNIYFESDFNGSFGAFCKLVRPNENIKPRYLATFFKSVPYKRHIRKLLSGALINNLKNEYIDSLLIPEISAIDQHHIANLLSKAETLITQRKETLRLLDEYLKSTFLEMFGDPVRNEKGFNRSKFGNFINEIIAGSSYGGEQKAFLKDDEFGVLKVSAVTWGVFNPKEFKVINKKDIKGNIIHPNKGDLLFSRANTRELVGATCIVDNNYPKLFLPDKLWNIKLNEKKVSNIFIQYLFKNKSFKTILTREASGTSGSMLNISMEKLRNVNLPIPPLPLQTQFAQIVEKTEGLKTQYQQSLQELENLYGSLSQRAFKGEFGS